MKKIILLLAFITLCTGEVFAQYALSPRVGVEIDQRAREYFGLFPTIEGFISAKISASSELQTFTKKFLASGIMRQASEESQPLNPVMRSVSVYAAVGITEFLVFGVQPQISDKFAIGMQMNAVVLDFGNKIGDGFGAASYSLGIKSSYYFDRLGEWYVLGANALSLESSFLFGDDYSRVSSGVWIALTVGHDGIIGKGIGIYWNAGLAYNSARKIAVYNDRVRETLPSFYPIFQLGLHFDF